jgi:hypothetical protein
MSKHAEKDSSTPGRYAKSLGSVDGAHGAVALSLCGAQEIQDALVAVLIVGDAVLFGTTRDGGAVVMTLFSGESTDKVFASTVEDLQEAFSGIVAAASS